ncbi:MAG: type I DNA topoisomerase, partial [Mahellales bacterium]
MTKNLVIVESPAKAKTIGKFLGKSYKVEASMGHIRDLPKSQMGIDIENNFEPKYITIRGKGEIINKIKKEAKNCKKVFLATDPDREGEAISWHLAKILNISENDKCRIEFNEITKKAIQSAIKNPRTIDKTLVDAQQARRVLDRLVGYKISPLLWRKIRKGLSAGRVQSVATRIICDRELEIQKFVPEEYWTIDVLLREPEHKQSFKAQFYGSKGKKLTIKSKEMADEIVGKVKDEQFVVEKVQKGKKKRNPPPPFTTSTLQQEASRKLGFTTKKTMVVAQQLYEGIEIKGEGAVGLITYIRTDSTRVSSETKKDCKDYILNTYGVQYTQKREIIYKNKGNAQNAHEAIRPTSVYRVPDDIKSSLSRDQYKLYKLVFDRFLASQMSPAEYDTSSITIKADEYTFKAKGSIMTFDGYTVIYTEGKDDKDDEGETKLPELVEGQILNVEKILPDQHFTQPPPRFTEASLVKILEEKGIGRPSTYAPTISTIISRGYITREKKTLFPTELGFIVTELMKDYFNDIVDEKFTAEMEKQLDEIEEGNKGWRTLIDNFYASFKKTLENADQKIEKINIQDEETDELCEKCGRNLVIKQGRYGKFLACPGFPECRYTKPIIEDTNMNCPLCSGKVVIRKSKKGRKFYGCSNYPECNFVSWDQPHDEKCPKCGHYMVIKSNGKVKKQTK